MLAVVDNLVRAAGDARGLAGTHGTWMFWNLLLAFVPVALAFVVFRPGARRGVAWWMGALLFVLFLPNAPYVITDAVHLFDDIRFARSDLQILGEFIPLYLMFFAAGFGCYVVAIDKLCRFVRVTFPDRPWWPIETALHVLCAVALYLGRVIRLNSWQVFTGPQEVLGAVASLAGLFPIAIIACTFVALVIGTWVTRSVLASLLRFSRRVVANFQLPII